ncbi:hypothetical protein Tco_1047334, partial [Tanacetum coccineum]
MSHSNAVMGNWGSTVKTSASYNWRNTRPNFNYNSGPTFVRTVNAKGNKDQLEDFEEFNGGSVTFGGSKGYISGRGKMWSSQTLKRKNLRIRGGKVNIILYLDFQEEVNTVAEGVNTGSAKVSTVSRQ